MSRLLTRLLLASTFIFLHISPLFALTQSPDSLTHRELDEVVASARRRPADTRSLTVVQTLTAEQLASLAAPQMTDALRRFAGITVKDYGGIGGLKTVSVRNLGAQHTGVIYDGIVVSDCQSGQTDLSRFSLDNVASLALAVGQEEAPLQSAKAYASAAVLVITTDSVLRLAGPATRVRFSAAGGSYGLAQSALTLTQRLSNRVGIAAHADYLRADGRYPYAVWTGLNTLRGHRTNSDISALRGEVSLEARPREEDELKLKAYAYRSERGLPGAVVIDNPYSAERLTDRDLFLQGSYKLVLGEKLRLKAALKWNEAYVRDLNETSYALSDERYTQREAFASLTALYCPTSSLSFTLSEDFARNTLSANTYQHQYPSRNSAYTLLSARYSAPRLALTASALHTFVADQVRSGDAPPRRSRLSPAVALSVRPFAESALRLRASYKEVYRIPTFNDMYYLVIGNANLRPERARQVNLGLTWSDANALLDYVALSADAYYNRVDDKIVAIPTMFIWKMSNADKAEGTGLDLTLNLERRLAQGFSLSASAGYSLMRSVDISDPKASNYRHQLPYTPRHSGNASADLAPPWLTLGYSMVWAGERYRLAINDADSRIAPYADHSLSASRTFSLGRLGELTLMASVSNLTNSNYEIIKYYPMAPRSYRAGLKYQF